MLFPFVADDWLSFEGHSFWNFSRKMEEKYKSDKRKKKDKENVKEAMAVPVKYDNVISAGDRQILYKVVSMECDTDYEGSLAVISCMLNRLESDKYPDDLMEVITEKAQFSAYYDKKTETYPYLNRVPSKECIQAVDDALSGKKKSSFIYIIFSLFCL